MSTSITLSVEKDLSPKQSSEPSTPYMQDYNVESEEKVEQEKEVSEEKPLDSRESSVLQDEKLGGQELKTDKTPQDLTFHALRFFSSPFEFLPPTSTIIKTAHRKVEVCNQDCHHAHYTSIGGNRAASQHVHGEEAQIGHAALHDHKHHVTPVTPHHRINCHDKYNHESHHDSTNLLDFDSEATSARTTNNTSFYDVDGVEDNRVNLRDFLYMYTTRHTPNHVKTRPFYTGNSSYQHDRTPPPYLPTPPAHHHEHHHCEYEYDISNGYGHGYYDEKDITSAIILDASPSKIQDDRYPSLPYLLPGGPPIATGQYYGDWPAMDVTKAESEKPAFQTRSKKPSLFISTCTPYPTDIRGPDTPHPSGRDENPYSPKCPCGLKDPSNGHSAFQDQGWNEFPSVPNNTCHIPPGLCPFRYSVSPTCCSDHHWDGTETNNNTNFHKYNNQSPRYGPNFTSSLLDRNGKLPSSQRLWRVTKRPLRFLLILFLVLVIFVIVGFASLGIMSVAVGNPGGADGRSLEELCREYDVQPRLCRAVQG